MSCCQHYSPTPGGADTFTVQMPRVTFGAGSLSELGRRIEARGHRRMALFTDPWLAQSAHMEVVRESLREAGIEFAEFSDIAIEPTDISCIEAARFYNDCGAEGAIAIGGGSVIDTTKAAVIYATHPADFKDYFAKPVGAGLSIPTQLPPIFACPTTGGTGSECTAVAVIRLEDLNTKFVIQAPNMMPVEVIIDPNVASTLSSQVVATSGFDLMSHAIECYTARAFTTWDKVDDPAKRVTIQGANPWSDIHAREALSIMDKYFERGVKDATDIEARGQLMWGAALAGMAFGNCGTHLPHAFSYGVSHLNSSYRADQYAMGNELRGPRGAFVPHGIAVIVNAPSVFRYIADAAPERHIEAARCLGGETRDATPADAGEIVASRIIELMRAVDMPNGLSGLGFSRSDAPALAKSAFRQGRAIANAPRDIDQSDVQAIFEGAVSYW